MNVISEAFSSKAKFLVLSVLTNTDREVSLRELSGLTKLPIFSVEGAVKALAKMDLVEDQKKDRYRLLSLNFKNSYATLLKSIFEMIRKNGIASETNNIQKKARESLRFSTQMIKMVRNAKR